MCYKEKRTLKNEVRKNLCAEKFVSNILATSSSAQGDPVFFPGVSFWLVEYLHNCKTLDTPLGYSRPRLPGALSWLRELRKGQTN